MNEREKYERVWTFDQYRAACPGHDKIKDFITRTGARLPAVVADLGCGTGRASVALGVRGFKVMSVDIAHNAPEYDLDFTCAPLWDLPAIEWDYAFSVDVLEHLPPDKVAASLEQIRERTRIAGYFVIAHTKDAWGPQLIGEPLHLTLQDGPAWDDAFSGAGWSIVVRHSAGNYTTIVATP